MRVCMRVCTQCICVSVCLRVCMSAVGEFRFDNYPRMSQWRAHCVISRGQRRSNVSTITRTKNSRVQALDRGDQGLAATELRLDIYDNCARSRCQANSSISGWAATAICACMQGQVNCLLDEPTDPGKQQRQSRWSSYRQCRTNFSGVNRRVETEHR